MYEFKEHIWPRDRWFLAGNKRGYRTGGFKTKDLDLILELMESH